MSSYRKVLIAVNGSKDVLVEGLKLVKSEKCRVTVVKVNPPYEGDLNLIGVKNISHVLEGGADADAAEIEDVAKSQGFSVKVRIEAGDIDKKIVEAAEEEKCDLIIMGEGGHNIFRKLFFGSLLDEVIHNAPCPVLVVNAEQTARANNFFDLQAYRERRAQKQRELVAQPLLAGDSIRK